MNYAEPTVLTSALLALVDAGISTDVQALLIHGDPSRGVKPNALGKAIEAARASAGWGSAAEPAAVGLPADPGSCEGDYVVDCEHCGGSGSVDGDPVQDWNGPYYPTLQCGACESAGTYTVHVRPIDFEDLADVQDDEADPYSAFAYRGGNP